MTNGNNNMVEFVIFSCKETGIPNSSYNYSIIGKNTRSNNPYDMGDPLKISVDTAKDLLTPQMINVPCLSKLGIRFDYDNNNNQIKMIFDDVKFDCDKNLKAKSQNLSAFEKICLCADKMRNGKCPYAIAKKLFADAYEKQK